MGPDVERGGGGADSWVDRLSEYLDGELTQAECQALESHLSVCPACAATLDELRAVVSRALTLEDAPPAEDLWPGIATRIGSAPASTADPIAVPRPESSGRWWARRFEFGAPQLAAAAVLLMALSAAVMWLVLRGSALPQAETPGSTRASEAVAAAPPGSALPTSGATAVAAPALAASGNPRYDAAIAELERAMAEGRGRLDPRTLRVVEENLRTIDRALDQARAAVAADPGNLWLRSHLAATMKQKVDLLRTATLLATAQG